MRREDFDFHAGKSEYEDVLQCNNAPSSRTPRGHQTPSAFLALASGLDKVRNGIDKRIRSAASILNIIRYFFKFPLFEYSFLLAFRHHYFLLHPISLSPSTAVRAPTPSPTPI